MSTGAPTGLPAMSASASTAVRICCQASHAETPVVGQPPRTWVHAAVCTETPAMVIVTPSVFARAMMRAHCRARVPVVVWIWGTTTMFGPAWAETQMTSSIVQLFPHVILVVTVGQPSADPKFHRRIVGSVRTNPSTQARACPDGPHPGSRSFAAETVTRASATERMAFSNCAQRAPPV